MAAIIGMWSFERRVATRRMALMTACAGIALSTWPAHAQTRDLLFIGGSTPTPSFGFHPPPGCNCGVGPGDTYNFDVSGDLFDGNGYHPDVPLPPPDSNDIVEVSGDAYPNTPVKLNGPSTPLGPVFGQVNGPTNIGGPFHVTGSGTLGTLIVSGVGDISGSITATDSMSFTATGAQEKETLTVDDSDPGNPVITGATFSGGLPGKISVAGTYTAANLINLVAESADQSLPGTLDINANMSGNIITVYTNNSQKVIVEAGGSIFGTLAIDILAKPTTFIDTGPTESTLQLNKGALTTKALDIGYSVDGSIQAAGQSALLDVNGGVAIVTDQILVGVQGKGVLSVHDGGTVNAGGDTYVAVVKGSAGSALKADGKNSAYTGKGALYIGGNDRGSVTVSNGANLTTADLIVVGLNDGSNGTLAIKSGGTVVSDAKAGIGTLSGDIAGNAGSTGTVTIDGHGSSWESKESFGVGVSGTGTLAITNGGTLKVDGLQIRVGRNAGGVGTMTVSGDGSAVDAAPATLYVGYGGKGEATISDNATIKVGGIDIGGLASGAGTLTLDHVSQDSTLGDVTVGNLGMGKLTVNGGSLALHLFDVATGAGSTGTVLLKGGAEVSVAQDVDFGLLGKADVTIMDGAKLQLGNKDVTLGGQAGGDGTLTITGSGSLVGASGGTVTVGDDGKGLVQISNGGQLDISKSKLVIGSGAGSDATMKVDGSDGGGSKLTLGDTVVGGAGKGLLDITGSGAFDVNGAGFVGTSLVIGRDAGSTGRLDLSNLTLDLGGTVGGRLVIGDQGSGTLQIGKGARVLAESTTLGESALGTHNLIVTGDGAEFRVLAGLDIGGAENAVGSLTIVDGGKVTADSIGTGTINVGAFTGATGTIDIGNNGNLSVKSLNIGSASAAPAIASVIVGKGGRITGDLLGGTDITVAALSGQALLHVSDGATVNFATLRISGPAGSVTLDQGASLIKTSLADTPYPVEIANGGRLDVNGTGVFDVGTVHVIDGGKLTFSDGTNQIDGVSIEESGGAQSLTVTGLAHVSLDKLSAMGNGRIIVNGTASLDVKELDLETSQGITDLELGNQGKMTVTGSNAVLDADTHVSDSAELNVMSGTFSLSGRTSKLTVSNNAIFRASSDDFSVLGTLEIDDGGQFQFTGSGGVVNFDAGSRFVLSGSSSRATGISDIVASGSSIAAIAGAKLDVASSLNLGVNSQIDVSSGTIRIGTGGLTNAFDPQTGKKIDASVLDAPGYVVVEAGGILRGTGRITGTLVNGGGSASSQISQVHPGNSPGTISVTGDYLQGPNGQLLLTVGASEYSKLIVGGTATFLGGTIIIDVQNGTKLDLGKVYNFVTATGGVTGHVDAVQTTDPFVTLSPNFAGGTLILTAQHAASSFASVATTINQRSIARALDTIGMDMASPLLPLVQAISDLPVTQIPTTFEALSPEGLVARQNASFAARARFDHAVNDAAVVPGGGSDTGAFASRTSGAARLWFVGTGGRQHFDGSTFSSASDSGGGFALGLDYQANEQLLLGLAAGYDETNYAVPTRATGGNLKSYHAAAYFAFASGPFYANATLGFSSIDLRSHRAASAAGFSGGYVSQGNARLLGGRFEVGARAKLGGLSLTPFAAIHGLSLRQAATTEVSSVGTSPLLALSTPDQAISSAPLTLGVKTDAAFDLGKVKLIPRVQLAYARELQDERRLAFAFVGAPATAFTIEGISPGRDSAHVEAGITAVLSPALQLFVSGATDRAANSHADSIRGGLSWRL